MCGFGLRPLSMSHDWNHMRVLTMALCLSSTPLWAQDEPPQQDPLEQEQTDAEARRSFRAGLEHAHAERWVAAEEAFSRALTLRWAGPIAFNLATTRVEMAHFVDAVAVLDDILAHEDAGEDVREAARQLRLRVAPSIARIRVRVDATDIELTFNGDAVPTGQDVDVDPGNYRVVARRDGIVVGRAERVVTEGAYAEIHFTGLAPEVVEPEVVEPEVVAHVIETPERNLGAIIGGISAGVVVAVVAVLLIVLAPYGGSDPLQGDLGTLHGEGP